MAVKRQKPIYCTPGSLVLEENAASGRRWIYQSVDPMEAMLDPDYFGTVTHLNTGDEIRLMRVVHDTVVEFADVLLIRGGELLEFLRLPTPEIRGIKGHTADWLRELLSDGPVLESKIKDRAVLAGLSWVMVCRAKEKLSAQSVRADFASGWYWALNCS